MEVLKNWLILYVKQNEYWVIIKWGLCLKKGSKIN